MNNKTKIYIIIGVVISFVGLFEWIISPLMFPELIALAPWLSFIVFLLGLYFFERAWNENKKTNKGSGINNKKLICWACENKIQPDEEFHEWKDGAMICNDCFKIYEKDEDKILAKIEEYEKKHGLK